MLSLCWSGKVLPIHSAFSEEVREPLEFSCENGTSHVHPPRTATASVLRKYLRGLLVHWVANPQRYGPVNSHSAPPPASDCEFTREAFRWRTTLVCKPQRPRSEDGKDWDWRVYKSLPSETNTTTNHDLATSIWQIIQTPVTYLPASCTR